MKTNDYSILSENLGTALKFIIIAKQLHKKYIFLIVEDAS